MHVGFIMPCHRLRVLRYPLDSGWIFAQHFCNRLGPAYLQLKNVLNENDPIEAEVLNNIKRRFREETFTRESIAQTIHNHSELVSVWPTRMNGVIDFPFRSAFYMLTLQ